MENHSESATYKDLEDYTEQLVDKVRNALYEAIKKRGLPFIPSTLNNITHSIYQTGPVAHRYHYMKNTDQEVCLVEVRHLEESKDHSNIGFEILICK